MRGVWRIRTWLGEQRRRQRLRRAQRAVSRFPTVTGRKPHELGAPLIVTLTSYPPRFPTLGATLRSLLDQTVQADRTILWLAEQDLALLPDDVIVLKDFGLEIRTCADLRSYKKLIPALQAFPDAWFATADDDVYYRPDWLEEPRGPDVDGAMTWIPFVTFMQTTADLALGFGTAAASRPGLSRAFGGFTCAAGLALILG